MDSLGWGMSGVALVLGGTLLWLAYRGIVKGAKADQEIEEAHEDADVLKRVQEATNEPLPDNPDDVRDLLERS